MSSEDDHNSDPEGIMLTEEAVRREILDETRERSPLLPDLIRSVAKVTQTRTAVVTAALWQLVDERQLSYGTDARLRSTRHRQ